MEVLVFMVDAQVCALPLAAISEVMRGQPIVPREGLPQGVLGTAIIRGQAVPVVDAGQLLLGNTTSARRLLLLRIGERHVALAVDGIVGPRSISEQQLCATPPLLQANDLVVDSIAVLDSELVHVLNSLRLITDDALEPGVTANHAVGARSS